MFFYRLFSHGEIPGVNLSFLFSGGAIFIPAVNRTIHVYLLNSIVVGRSEGWWAEPEAL